MSDIIILSIDVTKIDKSAIYHGKKGKYLEVVLLPGRNGEDQYGNSHMAVQGLPKERREGGEKGVILGNAKTLENRNGGGQSRPVQRKDDVFKNPSESGADLDDSEIPF